MITRFIDKIYPNHKLKNFGMFRVLRDSEIEIDDEADDLIDEFESALKARRRGDVDDPKGGVRGVIPSKQKYVRK